MSIIAIIIIITIITTIIAIITIIIIHVIIIKRDSGIETELEKAVEDLEMVEKRRRWIS